MPEKATVPEFATRMFNGYLRQIEDAVFNIHQQKIESVDKRIEMWKGKWTNAVNRQRGVGSATLLTVWKTAWATCRRILSSFLRRGNSRSIGRKCTSSRTVDT